MFIKFKKIKNNVKVRKGVRWTVWSIGVYLTGTSLVYSTEYWKDKIIRTSEIEDIKQIDEDVMKETIELKQEANKRKQKLNFDEMANKLQEIKNLRKLEKKND